MTISELFMTDLKDTNDIYPKVVIPLYENMNIEITLNNCSFYYYDNHYNDPDIFNHLQYTAYVVYIDTDFNAREYTLFSVNFSGNNTLEDLKSFLKNKFSEIIDICWNTTDILKK